MTSRDTSLTPAPHPVGPVSFGPSPDGSMTLGELQDELASRLAAALRMDSAEIDLDETFHELGVESVTGVEWIRSLGEEYGVTIRASAMYDWPTLRRFAESLHRLMAESRP